MRLQPLGITVTRHEMEVAYVGKVCVYCICDEVQQQIESGWIPMLV